MHIDEAVYTVLDVETTGLYPQYGHKICELGAMRVEADGGASRFECLVDPGRDISRGAFAVNGITSEMLEGKPVIGEVLPDFMDFMKDSVLVGYNTGFDLAFIQSELGDDRALLDGMRVVDALQLARRLFPGLPRYKLYAVAESLGIVSEVRHRAMADVLTTWGVFRKELEILREKSLGNIEDISWICETKPFRRMPPGSPKTAVIKQAIQNKRPLKITYRSVWDNKTTSRTITPISMPEGFDSPYLIAYCHLRQAQRNFRLDCIIEAEPVQV